MPRISEGFQKAHLEELRMLVEVAESGSLSAAAKKLRVPKSTVGRAIRRIEEDLGVSLVRRMTSGPALTAGGMYPGGIPAVSAPSGMVALPAPGQPANALSAQQLEDEAMISLSQVEGQMRASSLRKLSDIVGKHPDETLTIMRGWMAQENG